MRERFDLVIGFLGFFTVAFFVITLVAELTRRDALGWAITTLVFGALMWLVWLWRRDALRRFDAQPRSD